MIRNNYDILKERILSLCDIGISYEMEYTDDTYKKLILQKIFGGKKVEEEINELREKDVHDFEIYTYLSNDIDSHIQKENLVVTKDHFPIIHLSKYQPKCSCICYTENTYTIYQDNSSYISSRINTKTYREDNLEIVDVNILDSSDMDRSYYHKKYKFIIKENKIISLTVGNELFLLGENGFLNRSNSAIKLISKIGIKIDNKISELTNSDMKKYQIVKKKQD